MATGPEHYREAEQLLKRAHHFNYGDGGNASIGAALAAEAQVHATLALAAATALNDYNAEEGGMPLEDYNAWVDAAAVWKPKQKDPKN